VASSGTGSHHSEKGEKCYKRNEVYLLGYDDSESKPRTAMWESKEKNICMSFPNAMKKLAKGPVTQIPLKQQVLRKARQKFVQLELC